MLTICLGKEFDYAANFRQEVANAIKSFSSHLNTLKRELGRERICFQGKRICSQVTWMVANDEEIGFYTELMSNGY